VVYWLTVMPMQFALSMFREASLACVTYANFARIKWCPYFLILKLTMYHGEWWSGQSGFYQTSQNNTYLHFFGRVNDYQKKLLRTYPSPAPIICCSISLQVRIQDQLLSRAVMWLCVVICSATIEFFIN
jgi:hypothetical protein